MALNRSTPDRDLRAGRPIEPAPEVHAQSTPRPTAGQLKAAVARQHKFTALIDADTDEKFDRVTRHVGTQVGRIAGRKQDHTGGRYPARADVLRAVLSLANQDSDLLQAISRQVEADLTEQRRNAPSFQ